ncbi:MAG: hypothetical protein JWN62_3003 [Acidimicrobiales bacterium]|nr:hypothetical protein [Acidimicrobiales bacterium]
MLVVRVHERIETRGALALVGQPVPSISTVVTPRCVGENHAGLTDASIDSCFESCSADLTLVERGLTLICLVITCVCDVIALISFVIAMVSQPVALSSADFVGWAERIRTRSIRVHGASDRLNRTPADDVVLYLVSP